MERSMYMQKALDMAIMLHDTHNQTLLNGYTVDKGCSTEKTYEGYLENDCWKTFVEDMKEQNPIAYEMYSKGGGKEMEERTKNGHTYPPKMASFGSSSRLIFTLLKEKEKQGFLFEKKLHTTIGGTANLDGFMETADTCYFIEAKCREPYAIEDTMVSEAYRGMYDALKTVKCTWDDDVTRTVTRKTKTGEKLTTQTKVTFSVNGKEIQHFDMKQMICHLLGIATAYLKGKYDKKIAFIYLLYNPTNLSFGDIDYQKNILEIYNEIRSYPLMNDNGVLFRKLFGEILHYLQKEKRLGESLDVEAIEKQFSFCLCDQNDIFSKLPPL